jgi:hypothetical protein
MTPTSSVALQQQAMIRYMRTWGSPSEERDASVFSTRVERYERNWDWVCGRAFDDKTVWGRYRAYNDLYRGIKQLWDHVGQLVEFYATHVWAGTLNLDGGDLPDGVENAVPLAQDTDEPLLLAVGQLYEWWNWQERMVQAVRYTAALGELLIEIRDDLVKGRVGVALIWPGHVKEIELDDAGNVCGYTLEYRAYDDANKREFTYKKVVTKASISTFYNQQPHAFSDRDGNTTPAVIENPYPFVAAVWMRHFPQLGCRGEPCWWGTQAQLDHVNALLTHLFHKTHIALAAPVIVTGGLGASFMQRITQTAKRIATQDWAEPAADEETLNVLEGGAGTDLKTLPFDSEAILAVIHEVKAGIEKKCPEVVFYDKLREMTQTTGPSIQGLLGDVGAKVRAISAGYDRQLIKLLQMSVAIAGWRVREGDWDGTQLDAGLSEAQQKFAPFNFESWAAGDLKLNVMPRSLVPKAVVDRLTELQMKKLLGVPDEQLLIEAGYEPTLAAQWVKEAEQKQQEQFEQQAAMAASKSNGSGPPGQKPPPPKGDA